MRFFAAQIKITRSIPALNICKECLRSFIRVFWPKKKTTIIYWIHIDEIYIYEVYKIAIEMQTRQ